MKKIFHKKQKAFTLIEIMVSLSIFLVVVSIVFSSIGLVLNANKKSQNNRAALDNLNFVIESMTRSIRFGKIFRCSNDNPASPTPQDCPTGVRQISFTDVNGDRIHYSRSVALGRILKGINTSGSTGTQITEGVFIESLTFTVLGSYAYGTDYLQPKIRINIRGYAGSNVNDRSYFDIQTTVSQRILDI